MHYRWPDENLMLNQSWEVANHEANCKKKLKTNIQSHVYLLNTCQMTINKKIWTLNVRIEQTNSHVNTNEKQNTIHT